MVKEYEILLENGQVHKIAACNYTLKLLSRVARNDNDFILDQYGVKAKSVEDTIKEIHDIYKKFEGIKAANSLDMMNTLDDICIRLIPIFYCASNAYKAIHDQEQNTTWDDAKKALELITPESMQILLGCMVESVAPQGLPDEGKKKVPVKKAKPVGKK